MSGRSLTADAVGQRNRVPARMCLLVLAVLLAGGAVWRVAAARLSPMMVRRISLPVPLARFPLSFGGWEGQERPLSEEVLRIVGADDHLSRLYINPSTSEAAGLYVAYCARPRTMLGHRPQVCYVSAGWIHDGTESLDLPLAGGGVLPCLIHRFHQPPPRDEQVVVLNYYVLNGVVTNDESRFAGVGWRLPNIGGDPAWYVAQVQLSSRSEATVRTLAAETASEILARLPDTEGNVRAAPASMAVPGES